MKNLFVITILSAVFSIFTFTDANAQQSLGNRTNCDMIFAFEYGPTGSCVVTGYAQVVVPALTAIPAPMPPGNEIYDAKGTYLNGSCNNAFYVGLPCSPFPLNDVVPCPSPCGSFQANYSAWGVVAYY